MHSLRRPALVLTAAAIALFAVAVALVARLTTRPLTSAAPQATIFPTATPQATLTSTATPTPIPTSTTDPTPVPTSTTDPTPTPTDPPPPSATPELIMLVPPSSVPSPGSGQAISRPAAAAASCPSTGAAFATLDFLGAYKDNRLSDANPDLRLSILGYEESAAPPTLVDYAGATDPAAPRLSGLLASNRGGAIARTFRRYEWLWNEGGPPPYGMRSSLDATWPATVVELAAQPGEFVYAPPRPADIGGGFVALVLFAADDELTLAYHRQDGVADGYVVHLRSLCVDPQLVALYRAQLTDGRRASGRLPALAAGQPLGATRGPALVVAVRDRGAFMDPRSRKDWW